MITTISHTSAAPGADTVSEMTTQRCSEAENLWNRQGGKERFIAFGPVCIRLRYLSGSLEKLFTPSIAHAESAQRLKPTLTIYAIDCAETDFCEPPENWPFPEKCRDHVLRTHWSPADGIGLASDESRGIWHLLDVNNRSGVYWVKDGATLPDWEPGAPFRILIHWAGLLEGLQMVHTAAIEFGAKGVFLTGPGGSGKSTTTAAAVALDHRIVGDDFVLARISDGVEAYSVYDAIKLTGMALKTFPDYARQAANCNRPPDEKARIHLNSMQPNCWAQSLPIDAVMTLKISGKSNTEISPVSSGAALRALAPSTLFLLRTGFQEGFTWLGQLVRRLPCYQVSLGNDPIQAVETIDAFVRKELT